VLILTRNIGESLIIGDNIKVTVIGVNRDRIRIGIDAPKSCEVDREEIHLRKKAEREAELLLNANLS